jgi:hypothetical protein
MLKKNLKVVFRPFSFVFNLFSYSKYIYIHIKYICILCFLFFSFFFYYSYVHTRLGSFLPPTPLCFLINISLCMNGSSFTSATWRKLDQNIMSGHTIIYLLILQYRKLNIPINNVNPPYLENWYNNYLFYVGCKTVLWDSFKSCNRYMCSMNTFASAILIYLDMMASHEHIFSNIICI